MRSSCILIVLCLMLAGCDGDSPTTPTPAPAPAPAPAPTPPPTPPPPPPPPAPTTATLTGSTKNANGQLIGFVTVRIVDGADQGRNTVSDGFTGTYRFENLTAGNVTFSATGDGFQEDRRSATLVNGSNTLDFTLPFAPPPAIEIVASQLNSSSGGSEWGFEARGNIPFRSYDWDFGDGGAASNSRALESHFYLTPGVYLVKVSAVPTNNGPRVTAQITITVSF
jgi:PKD repeat protein